MEYNIKHTGQVFTPDYLVDNILDIAGYEKDILDKHIIDNSCGDGAFLCNIVSRYIARSLILRLPTEAIRHGLETYIHGVEIDPKAYSTCIENLTNLVCRWNLYDIKWDIRLKDALSEHSYDGKMDFVVGNPPYVRVHNLGENYSEVKEYDFAKGGMTDLYLVFFELGFRMLKSGGRLCYITPNSWLSSVAGTNMRNYVRNHHNLVSITDLGHYQAFKATTYTIISLFAKGLHQDYFDYYEYDGHEKRGRFAARLNYDLSFVGGQIYLGAPEALEAFRLMRDAPKIVEVKNGFATLADNVFIAAEFPFTKYVIPCLKASTGKWYKAFYPYDKDGKPLEESDIFSNNETAKYLNERKDKLLKGRKENVGWYLYGRTQALKDVYVPKISINTCIKDVGSIKLIQVNAGEGVYSGLYILTSVPFEIVERVLKSEDFISYLRLIKKYKSGGYYTFNSKELETYLNFKLSHYGKRKTYYN